MPFRRLAVISFTVHLVLWALSLTFSLIYLFHTDDAWYSMARERFLGTFLLLQLTVVPYYVGVAAVELLWALSVLSLWHRVRPTKRCILRFALLLVWFWLTAFGVSLASNFSSWFVPLGFLREKAGISVTHAHIVAVTWVIWINAGCFVGITLTAFIRILVHYGRTKWIAATLACMLLNIVFFSFLPASYEPSPTVAFREDLPNIVIVGSDSLRADHLGTFGYSRNTSPTIDSLAQQGIVCERLFTPTPSTMESLLVLLSGRTLHELGTHCIFPARETIERARTFPQLAETLQSAGYRTVAAGDWAATDFELVLKGFDVRDVDQAMRFTDYIDAAARRCHPFLLAFFATPLTSWAAPGLMSVLSSSRTSDTILQRAESEIQRAARTRRPLFLFLFFSTTHLPYHVPEDQPIAFGDPNYAGRHFRQLDFTADELLHSDMSASMLAERRRVIDLYDSCVRAFDAQVGRVLRALESNGIERKTLVIVLSDHGDDHWDPGTRLERSVHAGNQCAQIPLILRWPEKLQARRVPHLLRSMDFSPTLLEVLGLPALPGAQGVSFRRHLEGADTPDDREAYLEAGVKWAAPTDFPPEGEHLSYGSMTDLLVPDLSWETRLSIPSSTLEQVMKAKDRALLRGNHKIVYRPLKSGPEVRMYDLANDPHCQKPVVPDPRLLKSLFGEIQKDPPEFYLAWPRDVFEAAFRR